MLKVFLFLGLGLANAVALKPIHHVVFVDSDKEIASWYYFFGSSQALVDALNPDGLTLLANGDGNNVLYAIYRDGDDLLVVATPTTGGRFKRASLPITDKNGGDAGFSNFTVKPVLLTDVHGPVTKLGSTSLLNVPLYAYYLKGKKNPTGAVIVSFKGWTASETPASFTTNVPW